MLRLPPGDQPWYRYQTGMLVPTFDGDPEDAVMWAGESVEQIKDIKPAGDIVRQLVREAEAALRAYSSLRTTAKCSRRFVTLKPAARYIDIGPWYSCCADGTSYGVVGAGSVFG